MTKITEWFRKVDVMITLVLLAIIVLIFIFPEKVLSLKGTVLTDTPKNVKEIEVWVTLDRRVAFIDKESGEVLLTLSPDLAKVVMVSQLKLYEIEELQALKPEETTSKKPVEKKK